MDNKLDCEDCKQVFLLEEKVVFCDGQIEFLEESSEQKGFNN